MTATAATPAAPTRAPRAHTPTVLQMEVTECGAACLGMVLAHYGRWASLDELRERCGASRDGTTGADLVAAAAGYGLSGKGYYRRRGLLAELGCPLVLLWRGAHYVVLDGLDERHAWLNDPASGPRRITVEEFDRDYSKICLAFRPTETFTPGGERPSELRGVLRRARSVLADVAAVVIIGLLLTVPGLALAAASKLFVDEVFVGGDHDRAGPLVAALVVIAAAHIGLSWVQQKVLSRVATRLVVAESARFVRHALRLPERYFVARSVADLGQRVQQNRELVAILTGRLATVVVGLVVVAVYGIALVVVDPLLAAIAIALTLLNLLAMRFALRRQRDGSRVLLQEQSALWQTTAYGALTMESIKAGGLEGDYYARWEGTAVRVAETRQQMAILGQLTSSVPVTLRTLVTASVLGVGALRVIDGDLSVGSLIAFQVLLGSFAAPVADLVGFASLLQHARNLVRRLDDVLDEPEDPGCTDPAEPSSTGGGAGGGAGGDEPRLRGEIELRAVRFGFKPTRAPLIDGFDLHIEPGQRIAVVGSSGSGKSTLVRVLSGLYQPWDGDVVLDGRPRSSIPRAVLAASVGMVEQRVVLFSGTVRDNLTLWDDEIPDADVVRAAQDAQIHDEIVARAGGYAALVEDGGANWSGGQRQRFEIARALVRNPSILLLDEATSALDAETEAAVESALRRRGCTTLVVAHRLSTVRDADLILVMERGVVVERGRHDELLAQRGRYAELVEA